jgi:hypothetical protein
VEPDPVIGPFNIWLTLAFGPGMTLILLVFQPTDVIAIRVISFVMLLFYLFNINNMRTAVVSGLQSADYLAVGVYGTGGILMIATLIYLLPALLSCFAFCGGCCARRALAPRAALRQVWVGYRVWLFIFPLVILAFPFAFLPSNPNVFTESPISAACIFQFVVQAGISIAATPSNRGRVQRLLHRLANGKQMSSENEAALVAALVGGGSAEAALTAGAAHFRALPLAVLTENDLRSSGDSGLYEKTGKATLGEVHGFISHSWSDDAAAKHAQLNGEWGAAVLASTGGSALVWLDKACIDQTDIAANLLALPVFLSGCQELVVLAGKTYASRLWCCIELFTFAKMGGAREQVKVYELDSTGLMALQQFDASKARCFLPSDRERLLAVIETGFGDFKPFNLLVRNYVAAMKGDEKGDAVQQVV